ncbi:MAG: hydroxymethylglutaryl-CoA reductase, degradative [Myxococcales bacterium]|nr:hydroxymethylglutaryl-CoA reductase, degradative [Myxococcales bacterium]
MRPTSRIAGFYARPLAERVAHVQPTLSPQAGAWLARGGGLDVATADRMSENVIGTTGLPLALALNLRVNQRDYLVPMAVEEPSVVAAASAAARMARLGGGFTGDADPSLMTAQIHVDGCADPGAAPATIAALAEELCALGDAAIPRMVARGGGCRAARARVLDDAEGAVVVELDVDVGDAMGANLIDTVAEAVAPRIADALDGHALLRILTNLALGRRARARCELTADAVGGDAVADGIARASRFAELDVARAVTHNKGVMNGVDAAAVALGQDWRAIEAGAHGFAALTGGYRPLATWRRTATGLVGAIELPLALGLVGGGTQAPGVRAALELVAVTSTQELAIVLAAIGLASNLAALRALAGEGIQRGHMRLHARRLAGVAP